MNWENILRWIAVLPATCAGLLAGSIVVGLLNLVQAWFMGASSDSGFIKIGWIFSSLAGGALAVYWGSKTAPSHRKIVSAILTGIIVVFSVVLFILLMDSEEFSYFWYILKHLALIFGGGYIMHQIYEEGEDFDLFK